MAHVCIDFDAAGGVDLDRLERSLKLEGRRVGGGGDRICKHIFAALLREGNDTVVRALASLIEQVKSAT